MKITLVVILLLIISIGTISCVDQNHQNPKDEIIEAKEQVILYQQQLIDMQKLLIQDLKDKNELLIKETPKSTCTYQFVGACEPAPILWWADINISLTSTDGQVQVHFTDIQDAIDYLVECHYHDRDGEGCPGH